MYNLVVMIHKSPDDQWLEVAVEHVLSFGVFVRLPDGTKGYIRKRELDLDADVDPAEVVQVGQKIQAVIIKTGKEETSIELSRRATLEDPWPEFAQLFHEGDTVRGTVRALQPSGVFVRVQAGISGLVPLEEIATWQVDNPESVLWVRDMVEATITHLNVRDKRLSLSIKARMTHRDTLKTPERSLVQSVGHLVGTAREKSDRPITQAERDRAGAILVVDDHDEVRTSLVSWLMRRGFNAFEADLLEAALEQIKTNDFRVLLVDLNLVEKDGLELICYLRDDGNRAHICVMSGLDSLNEHAEEIEALQVVKVFSKPLDLEDIEAFLASLAHGISVPQWHATSRPAPLPHEVERSQHNAPLLQRDLQTTLEHVVQLIRAEAGLIFRLDTASRAITIAAQAGDVSIRTEAVYGLVASPVNDVMRGGEPVFENHVTDDFQGKI